mmetsp:Transcript_65066/g.155513  ORF Transcript_65066/g.155513 Transcript_65066/m.155513 type:complete len:231 (+) Transcript_65066:295-987(+)
MPPRHAEPHREREEHHVRRGPQREHDLEILGEVVVVLGAAVLDPVDGVPRRALHTLLHRVEHREVHEGKMHEHVEAHLLRCAQHPRSVLEFLGHGRVGEAIHPREPLAEHVHLDPILKATQIRGAEEDEDHIALPVNLPEPLALHRSLRQDICRPRLDCAYSQLRHEGVRLRERQKPPARSCRCRASREAFKGGRELLAHDSERDVRPPRGCAHSVHPFRFRTSGGTELG